MYTDLHKDLQNTSILGSTSFQRNYRDLPKSLLGINQANFQGFFPCHTINILLLLILASSILQLSFNCFSNLGNPWTFTNKILTIC